VIELGMKLNLKFMQCHQDTEDREVKGQAFLCIALFNSHFTPRETVFPSFCWKLQRPF